MKSSANDLERLMGKDATCSLKPGDVCKILKECRDTGVTRFEFNGLSVEFGNAVAPAVLEATRPAFVAPLSPSEIQAQETRSKEAIEEDNRLKRDEILAQLDILDPSLFEELAEKGALSHGSSNAS